MRDRLAAWAERRGYRYACGFPETVDVVLADIAVRRAAGDLDPKFDHDRLRAVGDPRLDAAHDRAILLVAVPRPAHEMTVVDAEGAGHRVVLPPTYLAYPHTTTDVLRDIADGPLSGCAVRELVAPLKAIAARLGLVRYGRNNIGYVDGLGSYFQLVGAITDADLAPGLPREPEPLPACARCRACADACATRAIDGGRFLLHAERCVTLFSESAEACAPGLLPGSPGALVGCLACQDACPYNRRVARREDAGTLFDARETALVLSTDPDPADPRWVPLLDRIARLGLDDYVPVLRRNLAAVLDEGSVTA